MVDQKAEIKDIANELAELADADILLVNANMYPNLDSDLIRLCRARRRRENLILIPVTSGGSANVAFRIARCLQRNYKRVSALVSGYCKSAGTLLVIGAHEIVLCDEGELGPLDVQLQKADDIWSTSSGLTVMTAFVALQQRSKEMFEELTLGIKSGSNGQITFRTASDIASQLVTGLFSNIYSQVEVMHVGEAARAMEIGQDYGYRLNRAAQNLRPHGLEQLVAGFSSHDFVIDYAEAEELWKNVREPNEIEEKLVGFMGEVVRTPFQSGHDGKTIQCYVNDELEEVTTDQVAGDEHEQSEQPGDGAETEEPEVSRSSENADTGDSESGGEEHKITAIKSKS